MVQIKPLCSAAQYEFLDKISQSVRLDYFQTKPLYTFPETSFPLVLQWVKWRNNSFVICLAFALGYVNPVSRMELESMDIRVKVLVSYEMKVKVVLC